MNVQKPGLSGHVATRSGITPGYMSGFGNGFETEALPGALQSGAIRPRNVLRPLCRAAFGSPFTAPRTTDERSWLYRIRPTVVHSARSGRPNRPVAHGAGAEVRLPIAPDRWDPIPIPSDRSFLEGLRTMTTPAMPAHRPVWAPILFHHPLDAG